MSSEIQRNKMQQLTDIKKLQPKVEAMIEPWIKEQESALEKLSGDEFKGYKAHTLKALVPEVLTSYPPAYIVGPLIADGAKVLLEEETEAVKVTVEEL